MNYDDEEYDPYAGFGGGCSVHGEDYMRECSVCGMEFCTACFPNSNVCEECAAQGDVLDEVDVFGDSDAEELKIVAELAPDDPELDKETEAALNSFGDPDDETAPSDDVLVAAEKSQEAVARENAKAKAKAKAAAASKSKTAAKPKSKPAAKPSAKKASSKARK